MTPELAVFGLFGVFVLLMGFDIGRLRRRMRRASWDLHEAAEARRERERRA